MHGPGDASTSGHMHERLEEGLRIAGLLRRNTEEMTGVLRALNGEYILPEAGGDLLRDGAGVLPTGASSASFAPHCLLDLCHVQRAFLGLTSLYLAMT